jgi:hypothetical protein
MAKPKGYVLYDGPSEINGKDIIAVVTLTSKNDKTGPMQQLWILDKHTAPHIAAQEGKNDSVCGDCPIKDNCYVTLHQAPLSVWRGFHRGIYDTSFINGEGIAPEIFAAWILRFGAYGDPAALPKWLVVILAKLVKDFTGYTHQWNKPQFNFLKKYVMASVESLELAKKAIKKGFRTFRIKSPEMRLSNNEIVCPSDNGVQCIDCKLCNGGKQASNIVINGHGARKGGIAYA